MEKLLKRLNYQPTRLTDEEINHPEEVLQQFFDFFPIHEARDRTLELYKSWICYSSEHCSPDDISDMTCFYTLTIALLNASYLCAERENSSHSRKT